MVAYDYGIKQNILRKLVDVGCRVTIVPATTSAEEVLDLKPDGVFLSNGPGDPEPSNMPPKPCEVLWVKCRSSEFASATRSSAWRWAAAYKLKFGHHGGNQPVMNLETRKVEITAQNHGFAVDPDSLNSNEVALTHINLNDQTLEGLRHKSLPLFSVQYHPEASPGPHDSAYLFDRFANMMEEFKK